MSLPIEMGQGQERVVVLQRTVSADVRGGNDAIQCLLQRKFITNRFGQFAAETRPSAASETVTHDDARRVVASGKCVRPVSGQDGRSR